MPGMSLGNAAEVTLQSGYQHMLLISVRSLLKLLDGGFSQAWETCSGR